jgi:CelD/BcsL family acetyltransferase involved in cellulose biosynthesis
MSEDKKPPFDLTPQGIEKALADGIARPATMSEIAAADRMMANFDRRIEEKRHNEALELERRIENEGPTELRIGTADGRVVLLFPKKVDWIALTGDEAASIAMVLMNHARTVGITNPVTLTI